MSKITELSAKLALKVFNISNNKIIKNVKDRVNKRFINLFKSKKTKNNIFGNLLCVLITEVIKESIFIISNAKKYINVFKTAFVKVMTIRYFDLKYHI